MNVAPLAIARVSSQLQGSLLLGTLQSGQLNLLKVQTQLSTQQRLNLASDDPAAALGIESLKRQISGNKNYSANLGFLSGFMGAADAALAGSGGLTDLINQAKQIASSQLGAGSTPDERAAQAEVVNSLLSRALQLGNTKYQGQSVFAGENTLSDAFVSLGGGYKYQGTASQQGILSPTGENIPYTMSGDAAFGAVSSQMVGYRSLSPALTATTRLADMNGATLSGVTPGQINLTVGAATSTIDLSAAATAGDVVSLINAGLVAAGSDATVAIGSGGSLVVTGDTASSVTFADPAVGGGKTAAQLGLGATILSGATYTTATLSPRITATTPLAAFNGGAGFDTSGIKITNGTNSATVSLAGMTTVEDLINGINGSGTFVRAEIKADGTGINVFNPLSGTQLTIGENGGTTADELGIRSFYAGTNVADLNGGTGVSPISSKMPGQTGQIVVTRTDGTTFNVTMDNVQTTTQLIAAINTATGNTTVTAALNATGNGITLTDTTGGPGNVAVAPAANYVKNGTALGIFGAGSGGTLTGTNNTFATDDFKVTRRDGTSFTVSMKGAVTIQDVLNKINTADGNTTPATQVTAGLNATGNGIQLSDASTGGGVLTVVSLNASEAPGQLGIYKTATGATPGVINGDDVNPLQPQGLFSSLTLLRDSLLRNDNAGIVRAAGLLEKDGSRVIKQAGIVGAKEQDVAARQDDATGELTSLKQALSLLADTDFTEAATRFQQLQTAYSASLQVAQTTRNMSLLDFLK